MQILDYFYTEQQASEILNINRITIWRWINTNKINAQRIGNKKRSIVLIPRWEIDLIKEMKEGKNAHH